MIQASCSTGLNDVTSEEEQLLRMEMTELQRSLSEAHGEASGARATADKMLSSLQEAQAIHERVRENGCLWVCAVGACAFVFPLWSLIVTHTRTHIHMHTCVSCRAASNCIGCDELLACRM
jgi:hypothetical protein